MGIHHVLLWAIAMSIALLLSPPPVCAQQSQSVPSQNDAIQLQAGAPADDCAIFALEKEDDFKYMDGTRQDRMLRYRRKQCKMLENGETTIDKANYWVHRLLERENWCVNNAIDPAWRQRIEEAAPTLKYTFEKYCRDTADPTKYLGVRFSALAGTRRWLRTEYFCQTTRYKTEPDSWTTNLLGISESSSVKRLHDVSLSLCEDLRAGKLDYGEARYRWTQEARWCLRGLRSESIRAFGQGVKKLIETLAVLFK